MIPVRPPVKPIKELETRYRKFVPRLRAIRKRAYAPYSHYLVGCLVFDDQGRLFSGCNVENASYPAAICAERAAIVKMVSRGGREAKTILLMASSDEPVFPCGMCLQVIQELGRKCRVIALDRRAKSFCEANMTELFPFAFSPDKLKQ